MNINASFDQSVSSLPAGFVAAVDYVVSYYDSLFTNNVTINIDVGYGEIDGQALGSNDLGESWAPTYVQESYSSVKAALLAQGAPGASSLPSSSPLSGSMYMSQAEAQALGLTSSVSTSYVGFSSSLPFSYAVGVTPASNYYYFVGVVEHEISEDMGRVSLLNDQPQYYSPIDLFRYSSPGVRDLTTGGTGSTAYFSINNGTTNLGNWNNQTSNGDLADWYPSGPAAGGYDAFNDYSDSGVINALSADDVTLMGALGWTTGPQSGIIVTGTTTDSLQGGSGVTLLTGANITDSGKTNLASATIKIANGSGSAVAGDELYVNGVQNGSVGNGVAASWNASADTLTLTGSATLAVYDTLLGEVTYKDTGTDSSIGSHPVRTVTWTVNDGTQNLSATSQVTVDRAPVANNDAGMDVVGTILTVNAAGVLSNDTDADADTLTVTGVSDAGQGAGTVGQSLAGVYGHLTLNANGSYSYMADIASAITSAPTGSHPQDVFTYTVSDGNGGSASATLDIALDRLPVVTTSNVTESPNQTLAASSLFTVTDPDGDPITEYEFWDSTANPSSGHFFFNGVQQPVGTILEVSASQLSQMTFVTGTVGNAIQVRAFDGYNWSAADTAAWAPFNVNINLPSPPVVTTSNLTESPNQTLAASSLFTVTDPNSYPITEYEFWDSTANPSSGHFFFNGVQQPVGTILEVSASQLSQMTFVTGTVANAIQVRAFDGYNWSAADTAAWAPFNISINNNSNNPTSPPVVTTSNLTELPNQTLAASSLFTVTDPNSYPITEYEFWDSTANPSSGHFYLNGVQQPVGTILEVPASQLSQMTFVTGTVGNAIQVRAFDGYNWSASDTAAWAPFNISINNNSNNPTSPPVVTTSNLTESPNQTLAASSLFTVTDPNSYPITEYEFWDSTANPSSGHFFFNGVQQPVGTILEVSASQLSQMTFVTGTVGNAIQVRAFDGYNWSAADTAAWAPFNVNINLPSPPVVTTSNLTESPNQTLAASSLFTVTDPNSYPIIEYEFWDSTANPSSGHFYLNGVQQPVGTILEVSASQLSQMTFVTGTVGNAIQVRAFDGYNWSASDTAAWAPFNVNITGAANSSQVVSSGITVTVNPNSSITLGDGNNTVTAGSNSSITLGNGNNTVIAGANDFIGVGNGQNQLVAAADDTWTVGTGQNTFNFNSAGFGNNLVNGFSASQDVIQFNPALFVNYAAVLSDTKQVGANTIITDRQGDSVTLTGVAAGQLTSNNVKIT